MPNWIEFLHGILVNRSQLTQNSYGFHCYNNSSSVINEEIAQTNEMETKQNIHVMRNGILLIFSFDNAKSENLLLSRLHQQQRIIFASRHHSGNFCRYTPTSSRNPDNINFIKWNENIYRMFIYEIAFIAATRQYTFCSERCVLSIQFLFCLAPENTFESKQKKRKI